MTKLILPGFWVALRCPESLDAWTFILGEIYSYTFSKLKLKCQSISVCCTQALVPEICMQLGCYCSMCYWPGLDVSWYEPCVSNVFKTIPRDCCFLKGCSKLAWNLRFGTKDKNSFNCLVYLSSIFSKAIFANKNKIFSIFIKMPCKDTIIDRSSYPFWQYLTLFYIIKGKYNCFVGRNNKITSGRRDVEFCEHISSLYYECFIFGRID